MPTRHSDDFLDDLFLCCAFAAYGDQATLEKGSPDCKRTPRRASRYYEEALADRPSRGARPERNDYSAEHGIPS